MKIALGNDHTALELKAIVKQHLLDRGCEVLDLGTNSPERCDYPVYGEKVALAVKNKQADLGVLICGTGVGISLAANKVEGIRAAVCSDAYTAKMCRAHNDANILAFGARVIGSDTAKMLVDEFLDTEFEGGRHAGRVEMISEIEKRNH
jgi:ribose-5-phosphate isomerase B